MGWRTPEPYDGVVAGLRLEPPPDPRTGSAGAHPRDRPRHPAARLRADGAGGEDRCGPVPCPRGAGHRPLRAGAASDAQDRALAALALWRGPALADFADEAFATAEISRLEDLRLSVEEVRLAAALELGRSQEVVAELETLVAREPLRERLWELLVLGLYRSGRPADALARYQQVRRLLDAELGLEPGPGLRGLQEAVLRQDPALLAAPLADRSGATDGLTSVVAHAPSSPGAPPVAARRLDAAGRALSLELVLHRHQGRLGERIGLLGDLLPALPMRATHLLLAAAHLAARQPPEAETALRASTDAPPTSA